MPKPLQQQNIVTLHSKLYEQTTPQGTVCVYQTPNAGLMLTLNDEVVHAELDGSFYHEMLAHSALFSHQKPQHIAILGMHHGILQEVLKHESVTSVQCVSENTVLDEAMRQHFAHLMANHSDARVNHQLVSQAAWLNQLQQPEFDILIHNHFPETDITQQFSLYYQALNPNGIFMLPCAPVLTHYQELKPLLLQLQQAGFEESFILNFHQPSHPNGTRSLILNIKSPGLKRIRERAIYNRDFTTHYYNHDTHKAALAMPEYIRKFFE